MSTTAIITACACFLLGGIMIGFYLGRGPAGAWDRLRWRAASTWRQFLHPAHTHSAPSPATSPAGDGQPPVPSTGEVNAMYDAWASGEQYERPPYPSADQPVPPRRTAQNDPLTGPMKLDAEKLAEIRAPRFTPTQPMALPVESHPYPVYGEACELTVDEAERQAAGLPT